MLAWDTPRYDFDEYVLLKGQNWAQVSWVHRKIMNILRTRVNQTKEVVKKRVKGACQEKLIGNRYIPDKGKN